MPLPPALGLSWFAGFSTEGLQPCPRAPPPPLPGEEAEPEEMYKRNRYLSSKCGRWMRWRYWRWMRWRYWWRYWRWMRCGCRWKERVQLACPLQEGHAKTFLSTVCCFVCSRLYKNTQQQVAPRPKKNIVHSGCAHFVASQQNICTRWPKIGRRW